MHLYIQTNKTAGYNELFIGAIETVVCVCWLGGAGMVVNVVNYKSITISPTNAILLADQSVDIPSSYFTLLIIPNMNRDIAPRKVILLL